MRRNWSLSSDAGSSYPCETIRQADFGTADFGTHGGSGTVRGLLGYGKVTVISGILRRKIRQKKEKTWQQGKSGTGKKSKKDDGQKLAEVNRGDHGRLPA